MAGTAWESGVLRGLQDAGPGLAARVLAARVLAADLVAGTSAGTWRVRRRIGIPA